MSIKEQLLTDLQKAMKNKDVVRRSTLRFLRSAISNVEIEVGQTLSEVDELDVVMREAKRRREAIEEYTKLNRFDLVEQAKTELTIIEDYLPRQVSRQEVEEAALKVIADIGGKSNAQMGDVMRRLMEQLKNRADGRMVSDVVRGLLNL